MSPTRIIEAFITRKDAMLAQVKDEGGRFEFRFLLTLVRRERACVAVASAEATTITDQVSELRQQVLLDLAPTDDTPGVLDAREEQALLQRLARLGTVTRHHAGGLEELAK